MHTHLCQLPQLLRWRREHLWGSPAFLLHPPSGGVELCV